MTERDEKQEGQRQGHIEIAGAVMERVRYGSETDDCGADVGPCHDCGVVKGELHIWGCDVERCPAAAGR